MTIGHLAIQKQKLINNIKNNNMAIKVRTNDPLGLLAAIKKAIDNGHVVTWSYDKDGDFTHTTQQWKDQAWLKPEVKEKEGELNFSILKPKNVERISDEIHGIYHGRFSEMLLAHFRAKIREIVLTT